MAVSNLAGETFGDLLVLDHEPEMRLQPGRRAPIAYLMVRCKCGAEYRICKYHLKHITRCKKCSIAHTAALLTDNPEVVAKSTKHGHGGGKNKKASPTHYSYWNMRNRCYYKKLRDYPKYGGRGIRVCTRWLESFENFLADMGERPPGTTLHRKDSDKDYWKDNCAWADKETQARWKTNSAMVEWNGVKKPLKTWCEELGVSYNVARARRLKGKLPIEILQQD